MKNQREMKRKILLSLIVSSIFFVTCRSENGTSSRTDKSTASPVIQLTTAEFKKEIFNYEANKSWKYEGSKPAIIDFYADWCGPCRQLSPIVEELAKEYAGKIIVYKVNTDQEAVLAQNLGIQGLPTLLFIPAQGSPQISTGLIPRESLVKAINDVLLVK
jgi:thioredoxin 1